MSKDTKPKDAGKSDSWVPKDLISEVKSFANKEGKQMVGFVRSAIRTVVNPRLGSSGRKTIPDGARYGRVDVISAVS